MAKELLGLREYSRHRGVQLKAVQDAIRDERISVEIVDGKKRIDKDKADKEWEANTDKKFAPHNDAPADIVGPSFNQSRAIREAYQAKLSKLEFEEKSSRLIDAEQVKRDSFELARRVRDSILNIPSRVASQITSLTDSIEVEEVLTTELRKALKILSDE